MVVVSTTVGEYPPDYAVMVAYNDRELAERAWVSLKRHILTGEEDEDETDKREDFTAKLCDGDAFCEGPLYAEIISAYMPRDWHADWSLCLRHLNRLVVDTPLKCAPMQAIATAHETVRTLEAVVAQVSATDKNDTNR